MKRVKLEMDLQKYYTDPAFPGSFAGADKFYKALKSVNSSVKRKDVLDFLKSSEVYTLHKPIRKPSQYRRIYTHGPSYMFQIDLVDMTKYASENDGYKFLITMINSFTKFAWAIPIKSKHGANVFDGVKKILLVNRPQKLQMDRGAEFYNKKFLDMLRAFGIKWYSTNSEIKAAMVERFNRTLRTRMERVFTLQGNHRYIDILPKLLKSYNNSVHRSIGMKPADVTAKDTSKILKKLYPKLSTSKAKFKVGDSVRITRKKHVFQKGFEQNWSYEVFKIAKILKTKPITYELIDYIKEPILGSFYSSELQSVKPLSYPIEKVLKKRRHGTNVEYLVKWLGYPEEANSWIKQKDLFDAN